MIRLFPGPATPIELPGAYLSHRLDLLGSPQSPFVYGSFVVSLDGRIALKAPGSELGDVPRELTSAADYRVLRELMAQADCFITNAGYLRAVAAGRLDDILQVGLKQGESDLAAWRAKIGLRPQPTIVVASASLDFVLPASIVAGTQRVIVATGSAAPPQRVMELRDQGVEVIVSGTAGSVEGGKLVAALGERSLRSLYLLAGPRMLETMLRDRVLGRLYLTTVHRLIGGEAFHGLLAGPELGAAGRMTLAELVYDDQASDGVGQSFARFDPVPADPSRTQR